MGTDKPDTSHDDSQAHEGGEPVPFESILEQLESLVKKLEDGNLSLEDSLAVFERGIKLAHTGNETLISAEKKIELLLKDKQGQPYTEPFPDDDNAPSS